MEKILLKGGIPVYHGLPRAVVALSKLAGHSEFKRQVAKPIETSVD